MMIYETYDLDLINRIANLPEILPHITPPDGSISELDFVDEVSNPFRYKFLVNEDHTGMTIFENYLPGCWEGHTLFSLECRGKKAVTTGKAMTKYMCEHYPVILLSGQTPVDNLAANRFNTLVGWIKVNGLAHPGTQFTGIHQIMGPVNYYVFMGV